MAGEGTLYARLAAAQAEMENPTLDKENPHFRNRFASLAAIRNAVVPCLARHGLACVQVVEQGRVVTRVYGPEGDSIDLAGVPVSLSGNPQANGSEMTYAKRYSLSAAFCVVGDEDDDGEAATAGWQGRQAPGGPAEARAGHHGGPEGRGRGDAGADRAGARLGHGAGQGGAVLRRGQPAPGGGGVRGVGPEGARGRGAHMRRGKLRAQGRGRGVAGRHDGAGV